MLATDRPTSYLLVFHVYAALEQFTVTFLSFICLSGGIYPACCLVAWDVYEISSIGTLLGVVTAHYMHTGPKPPLIPLHSVQPAHKSLSAQVTETDMQSLHPIFTAWHRLVLQSEEAQSCWAAAMYNWDWNSFLHSFISQHGLCFFFLGK